MDDLAFASAEELAALVRSGGASPREVVEAALRRIEALEPALNAFIAVDGERALAAADGVNPGTAQPFAGVPIAIKGNVPVEGMPLTYGSRFLADHRPDHSAYLVRRLREAGFVIVGVTNLPEFGILPTTEPRFGGPTRNPWDLERTPGGSSGGSAAAVAAGMLPLAHGNDGGGSLRIPAACCGLVGLKPSRGRVSRGPDLGESWLACDGVLTRTVADTAHALDVLGGYEVGDANWAPRPAEPYAAAMRRSPGKLRVAITAENPFGAAVDPEAIHGLRVGAELLTALGHEVVEASPAWPRAGRAGDLHQRVRAGGRARHQLGRAAGRPRPGGGRGRAALARAVRARPRHAVDRLPRRRRAVAGRGARDRGLLRRLRPARHARAGRASAGDRRVRRVRRATRWRDLSRSGHFTPYTSLFNVTGQPAISLPVGFGADGLPTGVQIVGKPLNEDTLLQVAAQMEAAHPWAHHRPAVNVARRPSGGASRRAPRRRRSRAR